MVHADQHAIVFRPGSNGIQAVLGNDGGVYYANNLITAVVNPSAIQSRNRDYNTVQFYYGTIDTSTANDNLAGGTQDNGTQFVTNAGPGANGYFDPVGGDGGFTEIDDSGSYVITTYPGNNHIYFDYPSFNNGSQISTGNGGSFINEAELDKNLNVLYTNSSTGSATIERISNFVTGQGTTINTNISNGLMNTAPSALKISPYTTGFSTLLVGLRNGRLLRVNFANVSPLWANITGPNFVGSISDIEFGQNEQEIFVTMHNYGVVSVWFTDDGGVNWTNIEGNLPDMPVKSILQNPLIPEELIIGTELGVWATPDYTVVNPVWVQAYNGMSDVTVVDLDLRASDNTILATTHGRGFFTSQFTSQPLSVIDNEFNRDTITLFPTVSNGQITIKSERDLGEINVEIFNINGQKVYSSKLNLSASNRNRLDLNLNSGVYFINMNVDNFSENKKIIIK